MVTVENVSGGGAKIQVERLRHILGFGKNDAGCDNKVAKIGLLIFAGGSRG